MGKACPQKPTWVPPGMKFEMTGDPPLIQIAACIERDLSRRLIEKWGVGWFKLVVSPSRDHRGDARMVLSIGDRWYAHSFGVSPNVSVRVLIFEAVRKGMLVADNLVGHRALSKDLLTLSDVRQIYRRERLEWSKSMVRVRSRRKDVGKMVMLDPLPLVAEPNLVVYAAFARAVAEVYR